MAARLSLDERVFIESSLGAGRSVADAAQRLGRDRSTVHRELARCGGRGAYDARAAHAWACARARRERTPKLAVDRVLAAAVDERLKLRWSPHATAADLREAGMSVCAETIYRACYANDARSGLAAGTWAKLPRRCRRRRPRSVAQAKSPARWGNTGDSRDDRGPYRARPLGRRPHRRQSEPHRCGHARRAHQPLHGHRSAARRLRRAPGRRRGHRGAGPPARSARAQPHLGPRPRDGPLGRRRGRARHRGVLLRAALAVAATHQRAPTDCCADGSPKAPASTSHNCGSRSSRTTSTTCPADSTTGHQHADIYTQLTCNTHNGWALSAGEGLTRVATGPSWCPAVDLSAFSGRRGAHRPARRM